MQKKSLKKLTKLIKYCLIQIKEQSMISLVMRPLKERAEEVDFQILIFQTFFQIFLVRTLLMIFLKVLVEQEEEEEDIQIIEVQI